MHDDLIMYRGRAMAPPHSKPPPGLDPPGLGHLSVEPPTCPHCNEPVINYPGFPNGRPHACAGLLDAIHAAKVAAAVELRSACGYTVVPPKGPEELQWLI